MTVWVQRYRLDECDDSVLVVAGESMGAKEQLGCSWPFLAHECRIFSTPFERAGLDDTPERAIVHQIPAEATVHRDVIEKAVDVVFWMTGDT